MMRNQILLIGLLFTINLAQAKISDPIQKKVVDKVSAEIWPGHELTYHDIEISKIIDTEFYSIIADDNMLGYVAIARSKGRYDKFQYAVFYTPDLEVLKVKMLKYSSNYGSEISGKKWLRQFEGNCGQKQVFGKDIQAISGATLSGRSITNDVPKLTRNLILELGK